MISPDSDSDSDSDSSSSISLTTLPWIARPGRELLRLAGPMTVSLLSFSTMTLVSTAFVAQVGSDELAAVGLGGVVSFAFICFGIGLMRASKTLVSQAVGAGRRDRIPELLGSAVMLAIGLGLLATLLGQITAPMLASVSASPRAGRLAADYLAIRSLGAVLVLIYAALRESSYGMGDTRSPMRASLIANGVNIALDALLILGLDWGVRGAAVAAICANTTELAMLAWPKRAQLREMTWNRRALREVWAQGMPNGLQFVMEVGAFLILTVMVARWSAVDGAAHQLVLQLINVSFLPALALGESAAVLVGQAVGAGRDELIKRIGVRAMMLGGAYALVMLVVYAVLGGVITGSMTNDPALASRAHQLLHVGLAFLVADAASAIARGVLRGASDVRYAAVVGILTSWLCTPPLAWLLGDQLGLGVIGGWIGISTEIIAGAVFYWLRVMRGGWRPSAAKARRTMAGTAV